MRLCYNYNIENVSNYFLLKWEWVIEKINSLKVKLIKYKGYRNCIWIKRIKTGEN